jgi:hypothetical protein
LFCVQHPDLFRFVVQVAFSAIVLIFLYQSACYRCKGWQKRCHLLGRYHIHTGVVDALSRRQKSPKSGEYCR